MRAACGTPPQMIRCPAPGARAGRSFLVVLIGEGIYPPWHGPGSRGMAPTPRHDQGVACAEVIQARGELGTAVLHGSLLANTRMQPTSVRAPLRRFRFCPDMGRRE
jgi:hypothetical protein